MRKSIHVLTKRISGHEQNGMPIIEENKIKLEEIRAFPNFVKHLNANNYKETPQVLTVISIEGNRVTEEPTESYQEIISDVFNKKKGEKIDYKKLSEDQTNKIKELEKFNNSIIERLNSLETKQKEEKPERKEKPEILVNPEGENLTELPEIERLRNKANSLEIKYDKRVGAAKLLSRIKEIEPEFK